MSSHVIARRQPTGTEAADRGRRPYAVQRIMTTLPPNQVVKETLDALEKDLG